MNKNYTQSILKCFLLIAIALSSGCAQSITIDSSTTTSESPKPKGRLIYSTAHGIFSFDIQSKTTNTIFSTDKNQYYSFVVKESIYISMGDGISGDIFKVKLDGTNLEQLTFDGNIFYFSVSPNGDYLAYSLVPNQLFVLDIRTKESQLVYEEKAFAFIVDSWSPDGKKFLFTRRRFPPGNSSSPISPVFLYTLEGKSAIELLPESVGYGFSSEPTWSPDGKNIALNMVTNPQSGESGIYILNIETDNIQQVADKMVANEFAWSPNGNMLLYENKTEPIRLNLFDLNRKKTRIIYEGQTSWYSYFQLWSPDSKYIAYFNNISDTPWYLNIQNIDSGERQMFEVPPGINSAVWIEK